MADVIRKATNKFTKGLVMDFSPENTKNELLTHALNATLLTFNGNELSLQNDMGNARVETAFLHDGYMPVGTCEYGGIIYIVSYNPLENKSQIGCFPSPERNISSEELGKSNQKIDRSNFQNFVTNSNSELVPDGTIKNNAQYVLLKDDNLNPGDKFLVCSDKDLYDERLADLWVKRDSNQDNDNEFELISHPVIALNVVSIEDSGKIIYLNSDIKQYDVTNTYTTDTQHTDTYRYHILGKMIPGQSQVAKADLDSYRNVLSSGYSVFKSKTSGRLAILAELIMIDSYSVTHEVRPKKDSAGLVTEGCFDVVIHTDITPEVTPQNYNIVPKLKYYHLSKSQGYLQATTPEPEVSQITKTLFSESDTKDGSYVFNTDFFRTKLSEIYTPTQVKTLKLNKTLEKTGSFNFSKPNTYHGRMQLEDPEDVFAGTVDKTVYTKFTEGKYHRVRKYQIEESFNDYFVKDARAKLYRYDANNVNFVSVPNDVDELDPEYKYFVKIEVSQYNNAQRDKSKYKDKNIPLYEMISTPQYADDDVLENSSIEKYEIHTSYTWIEAPESLWGSGEQLYIKEGEEYITFGGTPSSGNKYYFLKILTYYTPIGKENIDREDYDDIYYYPAEKDYVEADEETLAEYWDEVNHPITSHDPDYGGTVILYYRTVVETYRAATEEELLNWKDMDIVLYYKPDYVYIDPTEFGGVNDTNYQLFMVVPMDVYAPMSKFSPNSTDNYIEGCPRPPIRFSKPSEYPYDDPVSLHTIADFIPNNLNNNDSSIPYSALNLGNIKIPGVVSANGLDLPFKYDYTLVPCMNYGRLEHLAVSNTVDFSKLHAFNQSNFNTWKYHIDGSQLRLTFGADVYDTYETDKVDGLVLEFYDLWGFAGSIEITERKSYSGVFTKVIQLNSLNSLSTNRVEGSKYTNTFARNININAETNRFVYNGKTVVYKGYSYGWKYSDNKAIEDNDCGTLYSNILYGVKTYLRRTVNKGTTAEYKEFIPKKNFFLYTLPIYNDYYYTINDFSNLSYPQFDMMLTYKIMDSSAKVVYNQGNIQNGYVGSDKTAATQYTNGTYSGSTLDITKYYKYSGTSDLYLEIGLKKDYENMHVSYSPDINNNFTCKLRLIGEESVAEGTPVPTLTVKFDENVPISSDIALGYDTSKDSSLTNSLNKLYFKSNNTGDLTLVEGRGNTKGDVYNANFITREGKKPISIKYEFVVGYKAAITGIKSTEIQATTVCALCHRLDPSSDTSYNLEDFGVYLNESNYLSSAMLYNGGTASKELFGLCTQLKTTGVGSEQCQCYLSYDNDASDIKTPGKLNSGEPLKNIVPSIGKLTFCQPHVHSIDEENGVNMYYLSGNIGIGPDTGTRYYRDDKEQTDGRETEHRETTRGMRPKTDLFNNPRFNLSLNTKNMMLYYGECLSTTYYGTVTGTVNGRAKNPASSWYSGPDIDISNQKMRQYVGFKGDQVEKFNRKMIETMKSVYAYNPDYNSLSVNIGTVSVTDYQISFVSNLVSTDAAIKFSNNETLNDYIYLGSVKFTDYLNWLNEYSEDANGSKIQVKNTKDGKNEPLEQVCLVPGLDYCGAPGSYYLVTALTYNTPAPLELEDELSFKKSSALIVKDHTGTNHFLEGIPNKKALYGFKDGHLVQLDVSNYTIDSSGKLTVKTAITSSSPSIISVTPNKSYFSISDNYTVKSTYNSARLRGTSLTLNDLVYEPSAEGHRLFVRSGCCTNNGTPRNIIYYRNLDDASSWHDDDNLQHKNHLYLQTGPCFTTDNI